MVVGSIFKVASMEFTPSQIRAVVEINSSHDIFKGHFPGQPVLPGVCMLQLIKELVEKADQQKYDLSEADNLKFLSVVDPNNNKVLNIMIDTDRKDSGLSVNASLFANNVTFFKLKAVLTPAKASE